MKKLFPLPPQAKPKKTSAPDSAAAKRSEQEDELRRVSWMVLMERRRRGRF